MSEGVKYMLIASFFYLCMNLGVKSMPHIPPIEMVFFRAVLTLVISYFGLKRMGIPVLGTHKTLLITRGVAGFFGLYLFFITLQKIPLATAVTIQYTSPIFTALFGVLFFNQAVAKWSWLFYALAFGGVLVIKGFDNTIPNDMLMYGFASAISSGVAYNIIAHLRGKEHPMTVVFYFPLVTMPMAFPFMLMQWVSPVGFDWCMLLVIGLCTQIAQYCMTKAYQTAEISNVSLTQYVGVINSILAGVFLFAEIPTTITYFGIGLVLIGIIGNIVYTKYWVEAEAPST